MSKTLGHFRIVYLDQWPGVITPQDTCLTAIMCLLTTLKACVQVPVSCRRDSRRVLQQDARQRGKKLMAESQGPPVEQNAQSPPVEQKPQHSWAPGFAYLVQYGRC